MQRILVVCLSVLAVGLTACDPQGSTGPSPPDRGLSGVGDKPGDPLPDPPPEAGRFTFSISASDTDPYLHDAPPRTGPYDLYLWLVCSNYGLTHLEIDFETSGDTLVTDHFFSPAAGVASLVWEGFGELDLAVTGCPSSETLLGTLHLEGTGAGGRICLVATPETGGARGCETGNETHGLSCLGFASDGGTPGVTDPEDGCLDSPGPVFTFAISSSSTDWRLRTGAPVTGPYTLYLWNVGGAFSAVQGELHVFGGDVEASPSFSAVSPYIGVTTSGGADVLVAAAGCPGSPSLIGTILLEGTGAGSWVTMSAGARGGIADCGNTGKYFYRCLPYSSLAP